MKATETQIGGDHYNNLAIQPMEYSIKNNLDPLQASVIKYVTRHKNKGGREDIKKAIHCLEMILEMQYSVEKELERFYIGVDPASGESRSVEFIVGVRK